MIVCLHAAFILSISDDGSDVNAYDCHGVRKVFTKRYFFTVKGLCAIKYIRKDLLSFKTL